MYTGAGRVPGSGLQKMQIWMLDLRQSINLGDTHLKEPLLVNPFAESEANSMEVS